MTSTALLLALLASVASFGDAGASASAMASATGWAASLAEETASTAGAAGEVSFVAASSADASCCCCCGARGPGPARPILGFADPRKLKAGVTPAAAMSARVFARGGAVEAAVAAAEGRDCCARSSTRSVPGPPRPSPPWNKLPAPEDPAPTAAEAPVAPPTTPALGEPLGNGEEDDPPTEEVAADEGALETAWAELALPVEPVELLLPTENSGSAWGLRVVLPATLAVGTTAPEAPVAAASPSATRPSAKEAPPVGETSGDGDTDESVLNRPAVKEAPKSSDFFVACGCCC